MMQGCSGGGGGGRATAGSSRRGGDGMVLRKGPWMAEEDEILMEYVRKHGPRDWSSIRSKGLLPRTGKSCRLRWVNKLKPDLKTGCKFSAEEERTVIDLQARFGNKWARIATYLPGRTDNDVKNFWSTRQKRLARILQMPLPPRSNRNPSSSSSSSSHAKLQPQTDPHRHHVPTDGHQVHTHWEDHVETTCALHSQLTRLDTVPYEEQSSNVQSCGSSSYTEDSANKMLQERELGSHTLLDMDAALLPLFEPEDRKPCLSSFPMPQSPFDHFPSPLNDLQLLPDPGDVRLTDDFTCHGASPCMPLPEPLPFFSLEVRQSGNSREEEHMGVTESFFDDFSTEMLDYLEPPPPTSPGSC